MRLNVRFTVANRGSNQSISSSCSSFNFGGNARTVFTKKDLNGGLEKWQMLQPN